MSKFFDLYSSSLAIITRATKGDTIISSLLLAFIFLAIQFLESTIEKLIWGEAFIHWLDPILIILMMIYWFAVICSCAIYHEIYNE